MRETAMKDLESAATRIEILEADLDAERKKKWELVLTDTEAVGEFHIMI